jgi:hypothetical protein
MILVPLFDLKFLVEFAAPAVGTSNRRHQGIRPRRHATVDAQRMACVTDHAGNAMVATND